MNTLTPKMLVAVCVLLLLVILLIHNARYTRNNNNEAYVNAPPTQGPVTSDAFKRTDRLCSSLSMNPHGCDLHAFNQRSVFEHPLVVEDDIYVCNDNYTPDDVYRSLQTYPYPPPNRYDKISAVIHDKQKVGISRLVAKRILDGNADRKDRLQARHKLLKKKQTELQQVMEKENEEYLKYNQDLRDLGMQLWSTHCEGTPFETDKNFNADRSKLSKKQNMCLDTYWLW